MRQNKDFRIFVFTTFNALISLGIAYLTDTEFAVLLIPVLNLITKYINTTYFNDIGVEK